MSDRAFNFLRTLCEVIIPALATFYASVGAIWGWPYTDGVTKTLAAVALLIGAIVNGFRNAYNKKGEKHEEDLLESEQSDGE